MPVTQYGDIVFNGVVEAIDASSHLILVLVDVYSLPRHTIEHVRTQQYDAPVSPAHSVLGKIIHLLVVGRGMSSR